MKEKKISQIIILISFALIIFSWIAWFFLSKYSANYENRKMADRPVFNIDTYGTFADDYSSYFNDNLPFRNNIITLYSGIDYFIFGKSSNKDVLIGKENWLFYCADGDGQPMACYQGTNLYSENELKEFANNCMYQRDYLASQGIEFIIFIAPNKERVYNEYMPDEYGEPAEKYRALQVYEYLTNNTDLTVVYPYDELIKVKSIINENIYCKTDTHWNYIGGYIGAKELLKKLGIDMPGIGSKELLIKENGDTSGDLASMLNLSNQLRFADKSYLVEGYDEHNCDQIEYDFNGMWSFQSDGADPRCIYVIRDSFSSHMAFYVASQFDNSYFRHINTYSYDDLMECKPDIVVYETVERYLNNLMTFSVN